MSLIKKFANGGAASTTPVVADQNAPKKIKFTVNGKLRELNEEDIDAIYGQVIDQMPEEQRAYALNYVVNKLKPAISLGENVMDTGGSKALTFATSPTIDLGKENKVYSNTELKTLFKDKKERESFINQQRTSAQIRKSIQDTLASKFYEQEQTESEKAKQDKYKQTLKGMEDFLTHGGFGSSLYGTQASDSTGLNLALQSFAKKKELERYGDLSKWIQNYGKSILSLDDTNEDVQNAFKKSTGFNLADVKSKLQPYIKDNQLLVNKENIRHISGILGKDLSLNQFFDKTQLSNWAKGIFSDGLQQVLTSTEQQTTPTQSTFTGTKDGISYTSGKATEGVVNNILYQLGKPFTGYIKPDLTEGGKAEDVYNENNYGGYVQGKRLNDTQFHKYYTGLTPEQRKKLFPEYESSLVHEWQAPSYFTNLSTVQDTDKTIIPYLRQNKLGNYAQDVTEQYGLGNKIKGRIIASYDSEQAMRNKTPWAKNVKYYLVDETVDAVKGRHLTHTPIQINHDLSGNDYMTFMDRGKLVKYFLGKAGKAEKATPFAYPSRKKGGLIGKYALGGGMVMQGNDTTTAAKTAAQIKAVSKSPTKFKDVKHAYNSSDFKLSDTDIADLASLGADVAGLAAGFVPVPGATAVSAGLGLAGTAASLYSDVNRDGFQWSDAGKALASGALDVATLIPGLGSSAKLAKIGKTVKYMAPLLKNAGKTLLLMGFVAGAYSLGKLATGNIDDMSVDDWKGVVNGLRMLSSGSGMKTLTPNKATSFKASIKDGVKQDIQLTEDLVKELNNISDNKLRIEFLKKAVQKQLPEGVKLLNEDINLVLKSTRTPFRVNGEATWSPFSKTEKPQIFKTTTAEPMTLELLKSRNRFDRVLSPSYMMIKNRLKYEASLPKSSVEEAVAAETKAPVSENIVNQLPEVLPITKLEITPEGVEKVITTPTIEPAKATTEIALTGKTGNVKYDKLVSELKDYITQELKNTNIKPESVKTTVLDKDGNLALFDENGTRLGAIKLLGTQGSGFTRLTIRNPRRLTGNTSDNRLFNVDKKGLVVEFDRRPLRRNVADIKRDVPNKDFLFRGDNDNLLSGFVKVNKGEGLQSFNKAPNPYIQPQNISSLSKGKSFFQRGQSSYKRKNGGLVLKAENGLLFNAPWDKLVKNTIAPQFEALKFTGPKFMTFETPKSESPIIKNWEGIMELNAFKPILFKAKSNTIPYTLLRPKESLKPIAWSTDLQALPLKSNLLKNIASAVDPLTLADLGRTIAGNVATNQYNRTIYTPQYLNQAEIYFGAPDTGERNAYYNMAAKLINQGKQFLTSDMLTNQRIAQSNIEKANLLRLQGDTAYNLALAENRAKNAQLGMQYAEGRNKIANMNQEAYTDAQNKRIQLENTIRGNQAENLQNWAYRTLTQEQQKQAENKSIDYQLGLNQMQNQMYPDLQKINIRLNELAPKLRTPLENLEYNRLIDQSNKLSNLQTSFALRSRRNPGLPFDYLKEKQSLGISMFKSGGTMSNIANKNAISNNKYFDKINRLMESHTNLNIKNNLVMLKDILKQGKHEF